MPNDQVSPPQMFLLSPAYCGGRRAALLLRPQSVFPLAVRCRDGAITLGEAFAFMSGLYFRGKLAYANAFGRGCAPTPATLVITPTRGLQAADELVTPDVLREFAAVDIAADDPRYRAPLERDAASLASRLPSDARVVLLGSLASAKYVELLAAALGDRLHYPPCFVGRGDMSRGGLLLRSTAAGTELEYAVLRPDVARRGQRPPKLGPVVRSPSCQPAGGPVKSG
jgi:hypothetical protein